MADKDNFLKVNDNESSSGSQGDSDENSVNNLTKSGKRMTKSEVQQKNIDDILGNISHEKRKSLSIKNKKERSEDEDVYQGPKCLGFFSIKTGWVLFGFMDVIIVLLGFYAI